MDGEALPHVRFDQPMPVIFFLGGLIHAQLVADALSMFATRAVSSWFAFMSNAVHRGFCCFAVRQLRRR